MKILYCLAVMLPSFKDKIRLFGYVQVARNLSMIPTVVKNPKCNWFG